MAERKESLDPETEMRWNAKGAIFTMRWVSLGLKCGVLIADVAICSSPSSRQDDRACFYTYTVDHSLAYLITYYIVLHYLKSP